MGDKLPANLSNNWDLHAVVNCFSTKNYTPPQINKTTTTAAAAADESSSDPLAFLANMKLDEEDDHEPFSFPILLEDNYNNNNNINGFDELQDSYRPFFPTPSFFIPEKQQLINTSTVSPMNSSFPPPLVFGEQNNQHTQQTHHVQQALQQQQPLFQQQQQPQQQPLKMGSVIPLPSMMPPQAPRSRKRKTPIKKMVCQVKCEHLSADSWGWRKYGQKPIKGSPYPRNYYRCSSSKGCGARKQVERSNTDPSIYVVSYTGDHSHPRPTHRNSLAGSTRNKFTRTNPAVPLTTNIAADSSSSSSHLSATCQSPTTSPQPAPEVVLEEMNDGSIEKEEEEEEDDVDDLFENILIPNLAAPAIDEDFFKGLKHFGTTAASGSGGNDGL